MTWRSAAVYWLSFVALFTYNRVVLEADRSQPLAARPPFIEVAASEISTLDIERGGQHLHAERADGSWKVTVPAGSSAPADLVGAVVESLTSIPDVEVVSEAPPPSDDFGLNPPATTITLGRGAVAPITVRFGQLNPTSTAVYAQRGDSPRVYLLGRNLGYYLDLLLPPAGGS